jgi:hypothetical protein
MNIHMWVSGMTATALYARPRSRNNNQATWVQAFNTGGARAFKRMTTVQWLRWFSASQGWVGEDLFVDAWCLGKHLTPPIPIWSGAISDE